MSPERTAARRPLSWPGVLGLVALVLAASVLCALAVDDACRHTPPPVSAPEPGTDRAVYCDAIDALRPWLALVVAPTALAALAIVALRRRARWSGVAALAVVVLVCANATVAHSLEFAYTI